jgi:hypothetical protein
VHAEGLDALGYPRWQSPPRAPQYADRMASTGADAEEAVEACVRWAREQGAEVHAAVAGRTLVAQGPTAGAQQPHLVVAVPRHLLLTAAAACHTHAPFGESFQTLQREGLDELGMLTLLLTLHAAMGAESVFHPYVRSLPTSYQDPLWWGPEALAEVEVRHRRLSADQPSDVTTLC